MPNCPFIIRVKKHKVKSADSKIIHREDDVEYRKVNVYLCVERIRTSSFKLLDDGLSNIYICM